MKTHGLNNTSWYELSIYRSEIMGISIIGIMLFHNIWEPIWDKPIGYILSYGSIGVDIFLLLSGIGLYFSYTKSKQKYYRKRIARVLIPYFFMAGPYFIYQDIILHKRNFWVDITQVSFFTEGMKTTWYIVAILLFYLIFPFLFSLFEMQEGKYRDYLFALVIFIWLLLNLFLKKWTPSIYKNTEIMFTRLLPFVTGIYLGNKVYNRENLSPIWELISGIIVIIVIFPFYKMNELDLFWDRTFYSVLGLFSCFALCFIIKFTPEFLRKVYRFFGNRSIELYLVECKSNS